MAQREKGSRGYMSRVLRVTLVAPDIVEAILDGRQPEGMRLESLLEGSGGVEGQHHSGRAYFLYWSSATAIVRS